MMKDLVENADEKINLLIEELFDDILQISGEEGIDEKQTKIIVKMLKEKYEDGMRLLKVPVPIATGKKKTKKKSDIHWRHTEDNNYSFTTDLKYDDALGYVKNNELSKVVGYVNKKGDIKSLRQEDCVYLASKKISYSDDPVF